MDRELKSFQKTLKQFDKIAAGIRGGKIRSSSGRRMRKVAVLATASLLALMLAIPPFVYPVAGAITSTFFLRQKPESSFFLNIEAHKGLDIAAASGTPVRASAPGIVRETGYSESYGNYVRISHFLGVETFYAHLSEVNARKGRIVLLRSLRPIGRVGSTGRSTGPHLHFEVRIAGRSLPPRFFLIFHGLRKTILGV